jgi:hypothetical protein
MSTKATRTRATPTCLEVRLPRPFSDEVLP